MPPTRTRKAGRVVTALGLALTFFISTPALAQPIVLPPAPQGVQTFTNQGIQFSRVHATNVEALIPTTGNVEHPIGGGSWDFGLSRTEITQGQWIEFINAFNAEPIPANQPWTSGMQAMLTGFGWLAPGIYGTVLGPQGRFLNAVTPEGAVRPAQGMGWYGAALYCNWLQNNREVSFNAINTGVYDLRNWNLSEPRTWPLVTREANAQFWIPTYDEWAVGSFYDPNRQGPGQPGWWQFLNSRDRLPIPGPPGVGETSAGWDAPGGNNEAFLLPVAAYPNSQSPWGLLDTSGTFREQLDDLDPFAVTLRLTAGIQAGPFPFPDLDPYYERPGWAGSETPYGGGPTSFRIASTNVPASPTALLVLAVFPLFQRKRT